MPPSMWDSTTRGCAGCSHAWLQMSTHERIMTLARRPRSPPSVLIPVPGTAAYDIHTRSHTMTNNLTGKVALVTGGSRGIGAAIAKRLARDGAAVAITYAHAQQKADEVVHAIEAGGGRGPALRADSAAARAGE